MTIIANTQKMTDEQIKKYQPLVKSIAYKFKNSGEPLEDLEQVGYIGLINALNLYKPERGVKFETYATWLIAGEIRHYIRDKHSIMKIPRWMKGLNKNNRFPRLSEISDKINITEEGVKEILKARDAVQVVSLDQERRKYDYNLSPLLDKIKSKHYEDFRLPIEDVITIRSSFSKLKKIQRKVIYYIFVKDLTQKRVAKKLEISQRQVSRIKESALKDLKEDMERDN
jgi:RNA polymerase sigma-B factor